MKVYRYVSKGEAKVAKKTGYVPNTSRSGETKDVFYSPQKFRTTRSAEKNLKIGREHPNPAMRADRPTHRVEVEQVTRQKKDASWRYGGSVEGSKKGVEMTTRSELKVKRVSRLWRIR